MFMWSATASESSRSIGPTSRRMRPRLSSSFVRSLGSSAISAVACRTSMARSYAGLPRDTVSHGSFGSASVLGRWPTEPFRLAAALLLGDAPLPCGPRRSRRNPPARHRERGAELLEEPLGRELAVAQLAPLVLRDRSQHRTRTREHAALLHVRERVRRLHVEDRLDSRRGLLGVLSAGAARARD